MRTVETATLPESLDIEALQAVLRDHPVQIALLFGSHATDTAHDASDIDIAVVFESQRPSDPAYNETFFGLSADLSETLQTDAVDLVDLHTLPPTVAASVFEHGLLLIGKQDRAAELREQLTTPQIEPTQSPRQRLDEALTKIETHLIPTENDTETGVPASGPQPDDT
jgi:uncharacterized protein